MASEAITSIYQKILGKGPDASGAKYWEDQVAGGKSLDWVEKAITAEKGRLYGSGTPSGLLSYDPQTPDQIKAQAENAVNPLYNAEVEGFTQAADRSKQAYLNQIGTRQDLYDIQKQETEQLAGQQRQRASDQSLKRGLARSSIAKSDQARVDAGEASAIQNLQRGLQTDLNGIQSQITMLESQLADSLKRLDIDKATKIQSKIDELTREQETKQMEITAANNQYQQGERNFEYQKGRDALADQRYQTEWDWNTKMEQEKLALQKYNTYHSGSGGSSSLKGYDPYTLAITDMEKASNPYNWFTQHDKELQEVLGTQSAEYQDMKSKARAWLYRNPSGGGNSQGKVGNTLYMQNL